MKREEELESHEKRLSPKDQLKLVEKLAHHAYGMSGPSGTIHQGGNDRAS